MAIEIREYVGAEFVTVSQPRAVAGPIQNLTEWHSQDMVDENSIMVDIEGIHSTITRNNTYYEPGCLQESVPYWTTPYERPVIMHHNERDGIIIGRIKAVEYTDKQTRSGTPALIFTTNIPHEEGKKGIKNGTLSTVSIGAIAHDVRCSICGTNLAEEGLCDHEKGEMYKDKLCYWIVKKMEPKELSYVIVPSDTYAHNLRVYSPQTNKVKKVAIANESADQSEVKRKVEENMFKDLYEALEDDKVSEVQEAEKTEAKVEEKPEVKEEPIVEDKTEETPETNPEVQEAVKVDEEVKGEEEGEIKEETKEDEAEDKSKEEDASKIAELEKKIEELTNEVKGLHKKLDGEKKLRESAEAELIEFRTKKKQALIETVNSLRAELSLPAEDVTTLIENSEDMLQMNIKNLKEFAEASKNILNLSKIQSPVAVSEENDNTSKVKTKTVKEHVEDSNIDFVAEYANLFKGLI
jgi:hypothetical protein